MVTNGQAAVKRPRTSSRLGSLNPEDPIVQRRWAYADGFSDAIDEIRQLLQYPDRAERLRDDALEDAEFVRRVMAGDW